MCVLHSWVHHERGAVLEPPVGTLSVSFTENPFVCNSELRWFGTVSGAQAGERIEFWSPQLGQLAAGNTDAAGNRSIRWDCQPHEAGHSCDVTATGTSSGRTVSFTVTGA